MHDDYISTRYSHHDPSNVNGDTISKYCDSPELTQSQPQKDSQSVNDYNYRIQRPGEWEFLHEEYQEIDDLGQYTDTQRNRTHHGWRHQGQSQDLSTHGVYDTEEARRSHSHGSHRTDKYHDLHTLGHQAIRSEQCQGINDPKEYLYQYSEGPPPGRQRSPNSSYTHPSRSRLRAHRRPHRDQQAADSNQPTKLQAARRCRARAKRSWRTEPQPRIYIQKAVFQAPGGLTSISNERETSSESSGDLCRVSYGSTEPRDSHRTTRGYLNEVRTQRTESYNRRDQCGPGPRSQKPSSTQPVPLPKPLPKPVPGAPTETVSAPMLPPGRIPRPPQETPGNPCNRGENGEPRNPFQDYPRNNGRPLEETHRPTHSSQPPLPQVPPHTPRVEPYPGTAQTRAPTSLNDQRQHQQPSELIYFPPPKPPVLGEELEKPDLLRWFGPPAQPTTKHEGQNNASRTPPHDPTRPRLQDTKPPELAEFKRRPLPPISQSTKRCNSAEIKRKRLHPGRNTSPRKKPAPPNYPSLDSPLPSKKVEKIPEVNKSYPQPSHQHQHQAKPYKPGEARRAHKKALDENQELVHARHPWEQVYPKKTTLEKLATKLSRRKTDQLPNDRMPPKRKKERSRTSTGFSRRVTGSQTTSSQDANPWDERELEEDWHRGKPRSFMRRATAGLAGVLPSAKGFQKAKRVFTARF